MEPRETTLAAVDDGDPAPEEPATWQARVKPVVLASNEALRLAEQPRRPADRESARLVSATHRVTGWDELVSYVVGVQLLRDSAALLGGVNRQEAIGDTDSSGRARESLERLVAAMPRPRRVLSAAMVIVVLLLAQNLASPLADLTTHLGTKWVFLGETSSKLTDALNALGSTIDIHSVTDVVTAVRGADLPQLIDLVAAITLSTFIVCRVYTAAYFKASAILARPWALDGTAGKLLTEQAKRINVDENQSVLFDKLDVPRPRDFPIDLALKAVICAAPLLLCIYLVRELILLVSDQSFSVIRSLAVPISTLGLLVGGRLFWALRRWRERRSGVLPFVAGIALCVAAGIWTPMRSTATEERPTSSADPLRATLSAQQNLANIDLRNRNLQRFYLVHKDMRGAQLESANLDDANLKSSDLQHANLYLAVFTRANLANADLRNANLAVAEGNNSDLSSANLGGAVVDHAELSGAKLTGADLVGARISGSLLGVSARRADFSAGDLRTALLDGADLQYARFDHSDLRGALLANANFSGATLRGVRMAGDNVDGAKFNGANLEHANLQGVQALTLSIVGADLVGATVVDTEAGTIDATGADLRNSFIKAAKVHGQEFGSLRVSGADLRGATIVGLTLTGDSRTRWPAGYAASRSGSIVVGNPSPP